MRRINALNLTPSLWSDESMSQHVRFIQETSVSERYESEFTFSSMKR